jgi:hypothetical protein
MSPLVVSLTLAIAMALTAGAAFLYLRLAPRPDLSELSSAPAGVFPQPGGFDVDAPTRLIETECSATYVPVDGPEFTCTFPRPRVGPEPTRNLRGAELAPLALLEPVSAPTSPTRDIRPLETSDTLFDKVIVRRSGLSDSGIHDDSDLDVPTHRYAKPVGARIDPVSAKRAAR